MFETISMPEFEQLIKKKSVSIIDVREAHEYEQGHIADVLFIPMQSIPEKLDTLDYDENYYVICHSGVRSNAVCQYLAQEGYHVTNVMGGMSAWKGESVYGM